MEHKYCVLLAAFLVLSVTAPNMANPRSTLTMQSAMSEREYASSGIGSLRPDQQNAIDQWLNRWTARALGFSCGGTYSNTGEKQSIEENADGRVIILDDESIWLVEGVDQVDSALWLATEDVIVIDAKRPVATFKYTIINTEQDEQVLARYLGQE